MFKFCKFWYFNSDFAGCGHFHRLDSIPSLYLTKYTEFVFIKFGKKHHSQKFNSCILLATLLIFFWTASNRIFFSSSILHRLVSLSCYPSHSMQPSSVWTYSSNRIRKHRKLAAVSVIRVTNWQCFQNGGFSPPNSSPLRLTLRRHVYVRCPPVIHGAQEIFSSHSKVRGMWWPCL